MADAAIGRPVAALGGYLHSLAAAQRWLPLPPDACFQLALPAVLIDLSTQALRTPARGPLAVPGGPKGRATLLARDLVAEGPTRLCLSAEAGAGKSVLLRSLAYACAAAALGEPAELLPLPESWRARPPLPILLPAPSPAEPWKAWLQRALPSIHSEAQAQPIFEALAEGGCLVLVDCADVPVAACVPALAELVAAYGRNCFVVVGREPLPESAGEALGFAPYRLCKLDLAQIDSCIGRWTEELSRSEGSALEEARKARAICLQAAIRASDELRDLASLPATLVELLLAHERGLELPRQRHKLYARLAGRSHSQPDRPLLAERAPDEASATQLGLSRYAAAQALIARANLAEQVLGRAAQPAWHGALRLAATLLADSGRLDELQGLLHALLEPPPQPAYTLLAAGMLVELHDGQPFPALLPSLRQQLVELLHLSVPRAERITAGLLLGLLGDPRCMALLPDTVEIAAGPFLLGDDHPAYEDEGPASFQELPAYRIGRHPVTNAEYGRFLAANPAYPRPYYWLDPAHNNPSQPVVGVTWHDACAYCAWLSQQLAALGELPTQTIVRLPHEFEWEKAASWDPERWEKRRFPWGQTWDSSRANTADERGNWTTAPIGCYPNGLSFYGPHDMIGNVWEWTASEYGSYPGARKRFYEPNTYVLRGSSYQSLASNARCTYRSRLPADYWRHHLSFRIVIAQPR